MHREDLKVSILGEIGLTPGLAGSSRCREIRLQAAKQLPHVMARRMWAGEPVAFTKYANGLYRFAIDVAKYGDIGMQDIENTQEVIEKIIDLLIDLHDNKNNRYRQMRCDTLLYQLVLQHALFMPDPLTSQRELATI